VVKHVTGSVELASASSKCHDSTSEPGQIYSGGKCETTGTSVIQLKPSYQAASPKTGMFAASHVHPRKGPNGT
jgi:hypothetical protein